MKIKEFKEIYQKLNRADDIKKLCDVYNIEKDTLYNILSQKIVGKTKYKYYTIRHHSRDLLHEWLHNKSFLSIARTLHFSPVMTASIILQQYGLSKKRFWRYISNLDTVKEKRIQKELKEVCDNDFVYSPRALEEQKKKGEEVENKVRCWLIEHKVSFQTEPELRKKYKKTPDFLLAEPIKIDGCDINWIECKASFGDLQEFNRNLKKQLLPYIEKFNSGMIVYWYGFIDEISTLEGIVIKDRTFFVQK